MSLSLTDFFILASVLQGLFIGLAILFAPTFRSKANSYLASSILLMSIITFLGWQEFDKFWVDYVWSLMWEFLLPPVLFTYYLQVLNHPYLKAKWYPWLYAPFFLILVVDVIVDLDFVFDIYKLPIEEESDSWQLFDALEDSISMWYNVFVVCWGFFLAKENTTLPQGKRRWLLRFSIAMLSVLVVWFLSDLVQSRTGIEDPFAAIWLALSLFFWWICYAGVYRLHILDERQEIQKIRSKKQPVSEEHESVTEEKGYAPKLRRLMEVDQLFRNADLGRQLVAEHLGISEGYVSQVTQESMGEGFVEYINGWRIKAAKEMLQDALYAPYSLEAIGQEAGFKSRSAFYTTFKKATGQTPGVYRKAQKTS